MASPYVDGMDMVMSAFLQYTKDLRKPNRTKTDVGATIVKVDISPSIVESATKRAKELGVLKNSILKGEGNVFGYIGEAIVSEYITSINRSAQPKFTSCEKDGLYNYDLAIEYTSDAHDSKTITLEVKTKRCTSPPRLHYECSVAKFNDRQRADAYVFVRVHKDMKTGWILGYMPPTTFKKQSTHHKRGDRDKSNNFTFHADCHNIAISKLHLISSILA